MNVSHVSRMYPAFPPTTVGIGPSRVQGEAGIKKGWMKG